MPAERPFEPTGLTTALWKKIPPEMVRIDELTLVQEIVSIRGIKNAMVEGRTVSGDPIPHVVVYKGKKYLSDGHHRYVVALVRGDKELLARIFKKA